MKLIKATFDNIFSLGHVELDLDNKGLVLVTGFSEDEGSSNGAGKSSLANKSILWTLYGQTAGGLRADNVLNRHGKKKGYGEIVFIGNDGKTYTVRRERPAKLILYQGDNALTAKKATDTQDLIDQALGQDFNTFSQANMFGQGRTMSYASLPGPEQKKILEQILPIEMLDKWAEEAKEKAKETKGELDKATGDLSIVTTKLQTLSEQFNREKERADQWFVEHEKRIKELEIELCDFKDDEILVAIEELDKALAQLVKPDTSASANIIFETSKILPVIKELYDSCGVARKAEQEWNSRLLSISRQVPQFPKDMICPTCNRELALEKQKELLDSYNLAMAMYKEAEVGYAEAQKVTVAYQDKHEYVCRKLEQLKNENQELLDAEAGYNKQADLIAVKKKALEDTLKSKKEALKRSIDELKLTVNPHTKGMENTVSLVKMQTKEVALNEKQVDTLDSEHKSLLYWFQSYSKDIKLKLFAAACPYLDQSASTHLAALNNQQLHAQFSTVKLLATGEGKDEFNVRCWSDTGGDGFDSLSGGEQQMIGFAIGRALADLARTQASGESFFQILDEPFSMLDERNSENIVNYLKTCADEGTTLLISNEDHLKGLINNRIHVIKRNGVSGIE